jgi:two-component system sensor histidine kinase KdpD
LTNLLSNALKASPEGSRIVVTLLSRDQYAEAAVLDNGCGVPEGEREAVFRGFYTGNANAGAGLGLTICKSIVEAHDGRIGVEAPEPGGSRFWFIIPRTRKEEPANETATACR